LLIDYQSGHLAVAGNAKIGGVQGAFVYVLDYATNCWLTSAIAWTGPLGTNLGVKAIKLSTNTVTSLAIVGYITSGTVTQEILIIA